MIEVITVKQLVFSDLYLGHPSIVERFSDVPGAATNPLSAGPLLRHDLDQLTFMCRRERERQPSASEFKINYDDVNYRVAVMHVLDGQVYVLRKMAGSIASLAELGVPQAYIRSLMDKDLSGLFIISGGIKSGKSSTACAMIKARLAAFGGVAVSIEDPIELPLEGSHGEGVCYQTSIERGSCSRVVAFRRALRWGAKIILIDEINEHELAAEVLHASLNGQLIISTMLAPNVIQTINKLYALANEKLAPGAAQMLLADGLNGVLHQHLTSGTRPKLETEFLFLKDATLIKNVLRNGKYELLGSDIKRQMASLIIDNAAALRYAGG